MFISSRIQEGIADYIPSLNQGLAVLTNSTNFNYRGVKHQLILSHAEMRSVTTGEVFKGTNIPSGGLKKSMLHREVSLTVDLALITTVLGLDQGVYNLSITYLQPHFLHRSIYI